MKVYSTINVRDLQMNDLEEHQGKIWPKRKFIFSSVLSRFILPRGRKTSLRDRARRVPEFLDANPAK
jgi:hypothetical protein